MPAHARDQVSDALFEVASAITSFGGRVYRDRRTPIGEDALPALVVEYTGESSSELGISHDTENEALERRALAVDFIVLSTSVAERSVLLFDVEKAVVLSQRIGRSRRVTGLSVEAVDGASKPFYLGTLRFEVVYLVNRLEPEALL